MKYKLKNINYYIGYTCLWTKYYFKPKQVYIIVSTQIFNFSLKKKRRRTNYHGIIIIDANLSSVIKKKLIVLLIRYPQS